MRGKRNLAPPNYADGFTHSNMSHVAKIPIFLFVTWWRFGLEVTPPGDGKDVISMVVRVCAHDVGCILRMGLVATARPSQHDE